MTNMEITEIEWWQVISGLVHSSPVAGALGVEWDR